ncbi:MAG: hypothetical protein ABII07_04945 [Patescibacteria group bacterium]|nr:hypothetical protein [Patescibacteria group bacterium]
MPEQIQFPDPSDIEKPPILRVLDTLERLTIPELQKIVENCPPVAAQLALARLKTIAALSKEV